MSLIAELAAISDQAAADIREVLDRAIMEAAAVRGPTMQQAVDAMVISLKDQVLQKPGLVTAAGPQVKDPAPGKKGTRSPQKSHGNKMQCPYCDRIFDTRAMQGHCASTHPDHYNKEDLTRLIKIGPVAHKTLDRLQESEMVVGLQVRQIKPDRGTLCQGDLLVTARQGGLIEVQEKNGQKHKIDRLCLGVV